MAMMMTMIDQLLSIWKLSQNGQSIPKPHRKVCGELEALRPDCMGQQSLDELLCDNYVELNCQGEYILTYRGIQRRRNLPDAVDLRKKAVRRTGHEWDRFRKLISYYVDCIQMQEHPQVYLGADKFNKKFFVPVFSWNWLVGPGNVSEQKIIITEAQKAAMLRILSRNEDSEEIYIGYPVEAFWGKTTNRTCYTPMGLIPVDILGSSKTTLELRLRIDEAQINRHWLEFEYPHEEWKSVYKVILNLHKNDKYMGQIDLLQALPLLAKNQVVFDPNDCDVTLPRLHKGEEQVQCNIPVLFVGDELKYSKNQKNELKYIRDHVSDEILDQTALAYVFREPVLEYQKAEEPLMPLPFIDSNSEQMAAIQSALNQPVTKITGPPGTGKSQVAVNIIANAIFNDRTVFFSSNNHKAVKAIQDRAIQLLDHHELSLVNFCTSDKENAWYMQDLDALRVAVDGLRHDLDQSKVDQVKENVKRWRHIARKNFPRGEVLSEYEVLLSRIRRLQEQIDILFDSHKLENLNERQFRSLKQHIESLSEPVEFSLKHLWLWLKWRLVKCGKSKKAEAFLEKYYPDLFHEDREELLRKFREYESIYKDYSSWQDQLVHCEKKAKDLPPAEEDKEKLTRIFKIMSSCLNHALLVKRIRNTEELVDNQDCVTNIKNIMSFLRGAKSPYFFRCLKTQEIEQALVGVKTFLRDFPGWASTLKSLYRVSPCCPAVFDCVIIDEASQCDPASAIPALFRAKTAVFMGDSNQFPPVITLESLQNEFLKRKSGMTDLEDQRYDFMHVSAFDLIPTIPVLLREHFRCAEEIVDFCNASFYAGRLCVRTDPGRLKFPRCLGYKHSVEWIDIQDSREEEIAAVLERIQLLLDNHYEGSIGVISPFRKHADDLKERLYDLNIRYKKEHEDDLIVNTVNGFQGGEKDIIIFSLGYVSSLSRGESWYAESSEHRYIYNVAVSRARACLLIVGDRERCRKSGVAVLQNLAMLPKPPKQRKSTSMFDSVWEENLYNALLAAGIKTLPQYPLLGRRLDLAYKGKNICIDIEVDGVAYHTNSSGDRNMDDFYRDLQIGSQGWQVKRFWVYELRDDMPGCVEQIRKMIGRD